MTTRTPKEAAVDDKRLAVEVETATPGEARLVMRGDVDIAADEVLARAYVDLASSGATRVVLDFGLVDYINSTGIALIVRLLAEARRDRREVIAMGLSDHYREIFRITRLSDYLTIGDDVPATTTTKDSSVPQEATR
jgi:anti-anti-sigma factor